MLNTKIRHAHRIGIDARFYRQETGGLGRYTRELIYHLSLIDKTNQYTVFLTEKDLPEWNIKQPNFNFQVTKATHYSLAEQTIFLIQLYKGNFDLVHFLNFNIPILYRRPFVTTLHDLTMYLSPIGRSQKSKLRRLFFILVIKHSLRAAKEVIAISESSAKDAAKYIHISLAKIEVIYEGAPIPQELPFGNKALVQNYLKQKGPYFLFLSQWRPHKGIITLIEAFNIFKKRTAYPHLLVLVGDQKSASEDIKKMITISPYTQEIITPGFAPEELLPSLYHNATAFVMSSEKEGFGLPVLEAFAYQTPVIVADNSSLPEVAGQGGLYFPTKSADELAKCMQRIADEPALVEELQINIPKQLKKFSWAKMAQKTHAVYTRVLEKSR
jgi:glycosyltransferase involved in cell wall biosynthesis